MLPADLRLAAGAHFFALRRAQVPIKPLEDTKMTPEEALQPPPSTPKMPPGTPRGCPEGAPETSEAPLGSPKCTQNEAATSPEAPQGPPEASRNWPKAKQKNRKCPKHETSYFTTSQHLVFYEVKMIRASGTSLYTMRQHPQAQDLSRATFWL